MWSAPCRRLERASRRMPSTKSVVDGNRALEIRERDNRPLRQRPSSSRRRKGRTTDWSARQCSRHVRAADRRADPPFGGAFGRRRAQLDRALASKASRRLCRRATGRRQAATTTQRVAAPRSAPPTSDSSGGPSPWAPKREPRRAARAAASSHRTSGPPTPLTGYLRRAAQRLAASTTTPRARPAGGARAGGKSVSAAPSATARTAAQGARLQEETQGVNEAFFEFLNAALRAKWKNSTLSRQRPGRSGNGAVCHRRRTGSARRRKARPDQCGRGWRQPRCRRRGSGTGALAAVEHAAKAHAPVPAPAAGADVAAALSRMQLQLDVLTAQVTPSTACCTAARPPPSAPPTATADAAAAAAERARRRAGSGAHRRLRGRRAAPRDVAGSARYVGVEAARRRAIEARDARDARWRSPALSPPPAASRAPRRPSGALGARTTTSVHSARSHRRTPSFGRRRSASAARSSGCRRSRTTRRRRARRCGGRRPRAPRRANSSTTRNTRSPSAAPRISGCERRSPPGSPGRGASEEGSHSPGTSIRTPGGGDTTYINVIGSSVTHCPLPASRRGTFCDELLAARQPAGTRRPYCSRNA